MTGESTAIVALTTAGSREEADRLARAIVERRCAACVQVVPGVESVYWWEGRVTSDSEWLLLCKTTRDRYPDLEQAIGELHSYTTPEIIALPVERGSAAYLEWLERETAEGREAVES